LDFGLIGVAREKVARDDWMRNEREKEWGKGKKVISGQ
jgi:hypothetical protein